VESRSCLYFVHFYHSQALLNLVNAGENVHLRFFNRWALACRLDVLPFFKEGLLLFSAQGFSP